MKLMQRLSAVSAFARPEEHLARKTLHGAIGERFRGHHHQLLGAGLGKAAVDEMGV